jgi:hypothetical protein
MRTFRMLAILVLAVTVGLLAIGPRPVVAAQPPFAATTLNPAIHRFHDAYYVLQHNTFDYGSSLTSWLDSGFRSIELDIIDKTDWELDPNGPYVSHGSSAGDKNCSGNPDRLGHCLQDVMTWIDNHPGEGPILVFVDMKASWDPANAWHADEVYLLDEKIKSIAGNYLYTGDDLYLDSTGTAFVPGGKSLRQAVSEQGWPLLRDLQGKIIIAYTGGKIGYVNQTQGGGIEYILNQATRSLPYGFFCPDVESEPHELQPGGTVDGMSQSTSQYIVCSNLQARDHYQVTANAAAQHHQLIHLWGDHVYHNGEFVYNYIAVAHGISAIGRDSNVSETWSNAIPLQGVRRSLPGYFQLRPIYAQHNCIDVSGSGSSNGTKVQLWDCHSNDNQQFVYTAESQLRPKHANRYCVDIKGGDAGNGDKIHLWDCDGGRSEKWVITPNGQFQSYDDNRRYCLDVPGSSISNGTQLQTYTCHSGSNQVFVLEPVPDWSQPSF